jgi:hypothetical protein
MVLRWSAVFGRICKISFSKKGVGACAKEVEENILILPIANS